MLSTASKYPKKNLDCSLTLQYLSQKKRLGFESDMYHFDTCPRLLGLRHHFETYRNLKKNHFTCHQFDRTRRRRSRFVTSRHASGHDGHVKVAGN